MRVFACESVCLRETEEERENLYYSFWTHECVCESRHGHVLQPLDSLNKTDSTCKQALSLVASMILISIGQFWLFITNALSNDGSFFGMIRSKT